MRAQEQHGGLGVGDLALDSCQGGEALARPAFGQQRKEVGNGCPTGELVVGGVQEPFDGLGAEVLAELGVQPGRGGPECELLVDGQIGVGVRGQGDGTVGHVELR